MNLPKLHWTVVICLKQFCSHSTGFRPNTVPVVVVICFKLAVGELLLGAFLHNSFHESSVFLNLFLKLLNVGIEIALQ